MNAVASDPTRICLCIDSNPDCSITQHQVTVFPGQKFEIEAVAVGQRMGIVPSIAIAKFSDDEGSLGEAQGVYKQCTSLVFVVYSAHRRRNRGGQGGHGPPHLSRLTHPLLPYARQKH